jgi:hypothetical protein
MHIERIGHAVTPDEAINMVKLNNRHCYAWTFVKGKNGCIFEVCGRNYGGRLQMQISVPFYENGLPKLHRNFFTITNFTIGFDEDGSAFPVTYDEFIEYLKQDLRKLHVIEKEVKVIDYRIEKTLKFID